MTIRKFLLFILLLSIPVALLATHQRAGEISYTHVSGLTYEFTITTYTYTPSPADRPEIEIFWGDGSSSVINRYAKSDLGNDISKNTYISQHTFPAAGSYSVTFEDPNRNSGIVNIPNSVNIPFFLETIININPFIGYNSSPKLLNPPIDNGCTNVIYYHNPGAYDTDGDSLSYSLIPCRGYEGESIPGYTLPSSSNTISIDPITGDLIWDTPILVGEYNIAILIKEWRNGIMISSTVRDMQISIVACDNEPPEIIAYDTCIEAGNLLEMEILTTDPNSTQVTVSAIGGIFSLPVHPATFAGSSGAPTLTSMLVWNTTCDHVKATPYRVNFKALDNGPQVNLAAFKNIYITVVAPRPENLSANAIGNAIYLNWQPSICQNAIGYHIYRRNSSNPFVPDYCETGMPDDAGYQLLGTTTHHSDTSFIDDGSALPLYHGNEYCYRVVAIFADGAESYVSEEICTALFNDAPLITQVDVESTDRSEGIIHLTWTKARELDTIQFPGPLYEYHIFRASSETPHDYQPIGFTQGLNDTSYIDLFLNTNNLTYFYKIELWGEALDSLQLIETSDPASSIFIEINPLDRSLRLSWNEQVPWQNETYFIYRLNKNTSLWDSVGATASQYYLDQKLVNGEEYCYFIRSKGGYFSYDTLYPLLNRSQKKCEIPYDNVPPEVPILEVSTDCENIDFVWKFSSDSAYQDVYTYYIYYKPTYETPFAVIDSFENEGNSCFPACSYRLEKVTFITGCFAMAAIDSNGNLSALSKITCFDVNQCMDYRLPNVFTPNGDGFNDLFGPYIPYTNVEKIDMTIYNRWGRKVFHTEDPDINWDGKDYLSKQDCSGGTYFYACDLHLHTLSGVIILPLNGTITLIRDR
ncbi:MAG: gliding motility-associated C-terminal domain-containing protein [Bacteroidales bacterium]